MAEILTELCFKVSLSPSRRFVTQGPEMLINSPTAISSGTSESTPVPNGDATPTLPIAPAPETGAGSGSWMLKGNVTVLRHADRTPKQKLKYTFPVNEAWTQPFIKLLNGETEEIFLREKEQLQLISAAIEEARGIIAELAKERGEAAGADDLAKLVQLNAALQKKIDLPGTKAQLKPTYKRVKPSIVKGVKEDGKVEVNNSNLAQVAEGKGAPGAVPTSDGQIVGGPAVTVLSTKGGPGTIGGKRLEKFQLVFKWGGEVRASRIAYPSWQAEGTRSLPMQHGISPATWGRISARIFLF